MPLTPPVISLKLPDNTIYELKNTPGVTFIVGPNGGGKSYALKRAALAHPQHLLYIPPNREIVRANLSQVSREQEETYNVDWQAQEHLARYWSRAVRHPGIRALALSLIERVGLPQRISVEL